MRVVCCLSLLLAFCSTLKGDTHAAATCSQADVAAAIADAADGDTVTIPAGRCEWSAQVTVGDGKGLVIQGAGSDVCTIVRSTGVAMEVGTGGSRVTGICFESPSAMTAVLIRGTGWRIDHCKFLNLSTTAKSLIEAKGNSSSTNYILNGLIDNNQFTNFRLLIVATAQLLDAGNSQHAAWAQDLDLGGDDAVYIEDNTITVGNSIDGNMVDANYGGAYVLRYNTVNGAIAEAHSVQSSSNRATRKWEIYGNSYNNTDDAIWLPIFMRAGTGAIFNNYVFGSWTSDAIAFDNIRSFTDVGGTAGLCDGDSTWDGNTDATGYPCRDQIGRGPDATQWEDNPAGEYTQPLIPAYLWNNRNDAGAVVAVVVINDSGDHVKANRDYYDYNTSFDGTAGCGCGTLAALPETCTAGTAYWATDQSCANTTNMVGVSPSSPIAGTLYKCTATDTWTEYYTPYTYPHPLRGEGEADTTAPEAAITSPTSDATYETTSSPLSLGGTASDVVGVTSVTWSNDKGGSGTASGTTEWSITGISLQSGDNVITITARDAANNEGTDSITVTYTPPEAVGDKSSLHIR